MARKLAHWAASVLVLFVTGCLGDTSNELAIPTIHFNNGGTSTVSEQFANIGGGVPDGVQATFVGDVVVIRGIHFREDMKAFLGLNIQLAQRPDSIMTTPRHLMPGEPFVYTDPVSGQKTVLEIEADVEFSRLDEARIKIPAGVACHPAFTNPIVRLFGDAGSGPAITDIYHVIGPRCIAMTPNKGLDIGGFAVVIHGDSFSRHTQVAFRYTDPATNETVVVGNTPDTDIEELFVDRHTLVIPDWPGVVPNTTLGLAAELEADLLLFESIDAISGNITLEPEHGGVAPCDHLRPESPEAPLQPNGVRNSEKPGAFTFLPTGVTDFPSIAGITPEFGSEAGGNTVVIQGAQFDAFTADLSDPENPGIGIECPPDSGQYIAPIEATLVDRQTLVIKMPACAVDIPETVNFCLRNKFSIDNPITGDGAVGNGTCVIFEDIYTYQPIPPIAPPVVTAIFPANDASPPQGLANDFGLQRLMVVGDWFDQETALNGGVEFLLPGGQIVQTQRTIFHNRNLVEIYTKRLPSAVYPLTEDMTASVRVRNVIGHADFTNIMVFAATPDAGATPTLGEIAPIAGKPEGGEKVLILGENFDTSTQVFFGDNESTDVQFVNSELIIATAPAGVAGAVAVTVVDDGETTVGQTYTYDEAALKRCPEIAVLDPNSGSATGGYTILAYGAGLTPTTRFEFGADDGNFAHNINFISDLLIRIEVPEALPEQIGATVNVGATDPLGGCNDVLRTVEFTYVAAQEAAPEILFVDTTVEVPVTPTDFPALNVGGGDRMFVVGRNFDQMTTFDITKGGETSETISVEVLTPNLAVMTSPASPDGQPGLADLAAHNQFGDSPDFTVEYVEPGPPNILDVRNLASGTTDSSIDANDRLLIFGDNFFDPVTVTLTGCDISDQTTTVTVTLKDTDVTVVEDHLIGVNIPADTFCEGPLAITVSTEFGEASFENDVGEPVFQLVGPKPPVVDGVFPTVFKSSGGEEGIFFGRGFTDTTEFAVRTEAMAPGVFNDVLDTVYISDTVAIVIMPGLPGGMPPVGVSGDARAEETDATLRNKIAGDKFTVTEDIFTVVNDEAPVLLGVVADHGSINGGEQVLLIGANFLTATGASNISDVRFVDSVLDDIGDYTQADLTELPLDSLDPLDRGKFVVLNDNQILLITNSRAAIAPETEVAATDVIITSIRGNSMLKGGYSYQNTPAVRTPFLRGFTPNESRLSGGTSHLISGGFLTEVDRVLLRRPTDSKTFTIPVEAFNVINDNFRVFTMPDLSGTFEAGDVLDVFAEKDVDGAVLTSNTLPGALRVTFAGPPTIAPTLSPAIGGSFGGQIVELTGTFFTPNSQVLFGTMPAKAVVFDNAGRLLAIAPSLPVTLPAPGVALDNLPVAGETVDVAVFTQGGWAVVKDAFTFNPEAPVVESCSPETMAGGEKHTIVILGDRFIPDNTMVTATEGTVGSVTVHDFNTLSVEYTAPTRPAGTVGPIAVSLTVLTNQGTAAKKCDLTITLAPFLTACETDYAPNSAAAPTTGVHEGKLVKGTLTGGNFAEGGSLTLKPRSGDPVIMNEVAALTAGGQFRVVSKTEIEFTVPNVFNASVPNFVDGSGSVGLVVASYTDAAGRSATDAECFRYLPALIGFTQTSFTLPKSGGEQFAPVIPTTMVAGDVNADGVQDIVQLGQGDVVGWIMIADTFGDGVDINGDGKSPDFAGTYTVTTIEHDDFLVKIATMRQSKNVRLAQLDDDDQLEILIPGLIEPGSNRARIMILDMDETGIADTKFFEPDLSSSNDTFNLAVGNFDGDDRTDFAFITEHDDVDDRRLHVVTSPDGPFDFEEIQATLPESTEEFVPSKLNAGDFDGDGDDDLIYAQFFELASNFIGDTEKSEIIVVEIDSAGPTIVSQDPISNLTGGEVLDIEVFDANDDGEDDAFVIVGFRAHGDLFTEDFKNPGIAIILSPLDLEADDYIETFGEFNYAAKGDFNGDGHMDLAVSRHEGEFLVYFGDGEGGLTSSGRSWNLLTSPGLDVDKGGLGAGDINGDGLWEVFMADLGSTPRNIAIFGNSSR